MSDACPTVQIADDKAPGGFVVINEADFDAKAHRLYSEAPAKAPAAKKDAPAAKAEG
jgi:hypothetical protein